MRAWAVLGITLKRSFFFVTALHVSQHLRAILLVDEITDIASSLRYTGYVFLAVVNVAALQARSQALKSFLKALCSSGVPRVRCRSARF